MITNYEHKKSIYYKFILYLNHKKIIGAVCVGICAHNYYNRYYFEIQELLFFLMATTFLIGTFCLLLSCLFSLSTGGIISKTIYVSLTINFKIKKKIQLDVKMLLILFSGIHLSHSCSYFVINRFCLSFG